MARLPTLMGIVLGSLLRRAVLVAAAFLLAGVSSDAQAVYFEGYRLPVFNAGPTDPAASPDGKQLVFAARGWLWVVDLETKSARRITSSAQIDSRPAWSPDGRLIAFVRGQATTTSIILLELSTGKEQRLADQAELQLDPAFSPDGRFLYYAAGVKEHLDLWRLSLAAGDTQRLTQQSGAVLRPLAHPDGERLIYFMNAANSLGYADEVRVRRIADGSERVLFAGRILSQTHPALSPDGRTVAVNLPKQTGAELQIFSLENPVATVTLVKGLVLTPAWSADGRTIYFSEGDRQQRMVLRQVSYDGGEASDVPIEHWNWGTTAVARVRINSGPARLRVRDATGHPAVPDSGQPRQDGSGAIYFYSSGTVELTVPAGEVQIAAVRGLTTPVKELRVSLRPGELREVDMTLQPLWNPQAAGYVAADLHLHLNYGGPYRLAPEDLLLPMRAEDLQVATPMLANLQNRVEDQHLWGWEWRSGPPYIRFAQEVRPHSLGHVGLVATQTPFFPWFWAPGHEVYELDDRLNLAPLRHARRQGGVNIYVHPQPTPPLLIPDAVLGEVDLFELSCLWSDALGGAGIWYRPLNLGLPIAPSAGSDSMSNFFHMMPVGATRVYVRVSEGRFALASYLRDLKAGRSFVTNGPLLTFHLGDAQSGEILSAKAGLVPWRLELYSAIAVDHVEILVNGAVVHREGGLKQPGRKFMSGSIRLPRGGWVAARAQGGKVTTWPATDKYAFAHTGPIWIGAIGSTVPSIERAAATSLLKTLSEQQKQVRDAYRDAPIPQIEAHFSNARQRLQQHLEAK